MVFRQEPIDGNIEDKFNALLHNFKVIREPVHGDIWLTRLEIDIINCTCFQRLRGIKQLGTTNLVYPGAIHTRFDHSIGTVHIAQQIIDSVNKNYSLFFPGSKERLSEFSITAEDKFVIRIIALIHDMAHMSFGHIIEDEGNLFGEKRQWKDKERSDIILGKINPIIQRNMQNESIPKSIIDKTLTEIRLILDAEEYGEIRIRTLERPYIADMVGNTICADLLDYLKRDAYFTGLRLTYDERVFSYFVLRDYKEEGTIGSEKRRLAILLEKKNLRRDVLSHCIELLRFRYFLAERVYYHRVKVVFSAMIIKMVYCALEAKRITKLDLLTLGDDVLLHDISRIDIENIDPTEKSYEYVVAAQKIANCLVNRQLYVAIKAINGHTEAQASNVKYLEDPKERYDLEKYLEDAFELERGSIIVYCTKKDEGKAAMVKVFMRSRRPSVRTLKDFGECNKDLLIDQEINVLNNKYSGLWTFYFLIKKDYEDRKEKFKPVCEAIVEGNKENLFEKIVQFKQDIFEERNRDISWRSFEVRKKIVDELLVTDTNPRDSSIFKTIDEKLREATRRS